MHAVFMLYGARGTVEHLIRDMEAQKMQFKIWKGDEVKNIWINGTFRHLPFGVMEYVYPKESADLVLTTLEFDKNPYHLYGWKYKTALAFLRNVLKVSKIPKFKTDKAFLWYKEDVHIIPIGVKYDAEMIEEKGDYVGFRHESI